MIRPHPSEDILRNVSFLAYLDENGIPRYVGSAFFLGTEPGDEQGKSAGLYWVTARHVIKGIIDLDSEKTKEPGYVYLRVNSKEGCIFIRTRVEDWYLASDPAADVAVFRAGLPISADVRSTSEKMFLDEKASNRLAMSVGDQILIPGLFSRSIGTLRNVPILRKGTIAFLADRAELVPTKVGPMFAHLMEARSIGGVSGSPVYIMPSLTRVLTGKFGAEAPHIFLMGLVSAHYPADIRDIDRFAFDPRHDAMDHLNSGIAVVTPISTILKVIEKSKLKGKPKLTFVAKTKLSLADVEIYEISSLVEEVAPLLKAFLLAKAELKPDGD